MKRLLIIYNNEQVLSVEAHVGGITYTAENMLLDTKDNALAMLQAKGIDCTALEDYIP